jgi:amino acid permease
MDIMKVIILGGVTVIFYVVSFLFIYRSFSIYTNWKNKKNETEKLLNIIEILVYFILMVLMTLAVDNILNDVITKLMKNL